MICSPVIQSFCGLTLIYRSNTRRPHLAPLVARSRLFFHIISVAQPRTNTFVKKTGPHQKSCIAIRAHILPFYNKGVCRRPNVDNKIEISLKKCKEMKKQHSGDRIQDTEDKKMWEFRIENVELC